MTAFDDVVAGINGGSKLHWYKFNDTSGNWVDAGTANEPLTPSGIGSAVTYAVTGSEQADAGTKAVFYAGIGTTGGEPRPFKGINAMEGVGSNIFSAFISWKTSNNSAGGDTGATLFSIGRDTQRVFQLVLVRNSDGNGKIFCDIFDSSGNGTRTEVFAVDQPTPWDNDEWHSIGIVQRGDGNGIILYYDGIKPTQTASLFGTGGFNDGFQTVGLNANDDMAVGSHNGITLVQKTIEATMDNAMMWKNYALTAQEFFDLMAQSSSAAVPKNVRRRGRKLYLATL